MTGSLIGMEIGGLVQGTATVTVTISNTGDVSNNFAATLNVGPGGTQTGSGCDMAYPEGTGYSLKSAVIEPGQQGTIQWTVDMAGKDPGSYYAAVKLYRGPADLVCLDGDLATFTVEAPTVSAEIVSISVS